MFGTWCEAATSSLSWDTMMWVLFLHLAILVWRLACVCVQRPWMRTRTRTHIACHKDYIFIIESSTTTMETRYRWVPLNWKLRQECDYEITSDEGQFGLRRIRIKRDKPAWSFVLNQWSHHLLCSNTFLPAVFQRISTLRECCEYIRLP